MSTIRFWILFFVLAGFLVGFSVPVYSASFSAEQIADRPIKGNTLVSGVIEKIGKDYDYILVNGKRYNLSANCVVKSEPDFMNEEGDVGELSIGLSVRFIPKGNLVETITIVVPM